MKKFIINFANDNEINDLALKKYPKLETGLISGWEDTNEIKREVFIETIKWLIQEGLMIYNNKNK